ncbi:MAG: 50S ribosomal protein L10, partial [Nanoarchaeota archaeon]
YKNNIGKAGRWALNLAVEMAYPTKDTTALLVQKAFRDAKGLGVTRGIMAKELVSDILAKAEREMLSIKQAVGC